MQRKQVSVLVGVAVALVLLVGMFSGCETGGTAGLEKRDCVVMLGDSIFALSGMEYEYLKDLSGQAYRIYYKSGAQMSGGSIIAAQDILDQYNTAKREGNIRTIIMDGGGNDSLLGPVGQSNAAMEREVAAAWNTILTNAKNDGVQHLIVQGYYKTNASTESAAMDQWRDKTEVELIAKAKEIGLHLVYIDPRDDAWFSSKRPAQYCKADGIHPTDPASERLAQLVWDAMVKNNIEQGEGCTSGSTGGTTGGCR